MLKNTSSSNGSKIVEICNPFEKMRDLKNNDQSVLRQSTSKKVWNLSNDKAELTSKIIKELELTKSELFRYLSSQENQKNCLAYFSPETIFSSRLPMAPFPMPKYVMDKGAYVNHWLSDGWPNMPCQFPPDHFVPYFMDGSSSSSSLTSSSTLSHSFHNIQYVGYPRFGGKMSRKHRRHRNDSDSSSSIRRKRRKKRKCKKPKFDDSFSTLENVEDWTMKKGMRAGPDITPLLIINEKKRLKRLRRKCSDIDCFKQFQSLDRLLTALYKKIKKLDERGSVTSSETREARKRLEIRRKTREKAFSESKNLNESKKSGEIKMGDDTAQDIAILKEKIATFQDLLTKRLE